MDAISVVLKLVDQLSAPAKKAKEALYGVTKAAEGVSSSAKGVTAATSAVTKATEGATAASRAASAVSKGAAASAIQAAAATHKVTDAVAATTSAATAATKATRGLTAGQFALGRAVLDTQRRYSIAAPAIARSSYMLGMSMRVVGIGVRDAAETALSMGRVAASLGRQIITATGLSAAGIIAVGRSYATALDSQGKFARQTGLSVQALRELGFVAKRQDVPVETLNSGLENFQKRLGELKMRHGGLDKLLGRVDPKLRNNLRAEKDPAKSFDMVIAAMSRVKDPAKRMVLAQAAFGEAGAEMVRFALLGAEGLANMREEARRLHGELGPKALEDAERFNDAIDNTWDTLIGLRNSIAGAILPIVTPIIEATQKLLIANRDIIAAGIADTVSAVTGAVRSFDWAGFVENIRAIADVVKLAAKAVGGFGNLLIGIAALPFLVAIKNIAVGLIGTLVFLLKIGSRLRWVFGGLGKALASNLAMAIPAFNRVGSAARGARTEMIGFGRSAGGMRRMLAVGGWLTMGSMIVDDIGKTKEQRLDEMRQNWEWWDELDKKLQNTAAGQWWQAAVEKVQQWKTDIVGSLSTLGNDLVNIGKGWVSSLAAGFRSGWAEFVEWLRSSVNAIKNMIPSLSGWVGGGETGNSPAAANDNATTGALPTPKTMADVVNNVDQSRQMQQTVTVNNSVTVNAATNATPAAIGSATAGAAERGTRRAMSGLHDGGLAGSTYLAGP